MRNHVLRATALVAALALGGLAFAQPAEAGRYHRHGGNGGALAFGLIAGALVGGAIASRNAYAYDRPVRVYEYADTGPVYDNYALEPWSPEWYESCSARFRSFDPDSGTYQPYEGPRQFCR